MPRRRKVAVAQQENVEPSEKLEIVTKKIVKPEKPSKKQKREPDWASGDGLNVIKIILSMQKSDCNSNKCSTELVKLYKRMEHKTFMTALLKMTRMFMNREEGDEIATRILKFIGLFVASFGEDVNEETGETHPIITDLFNEILSLTSNIVQTRVNLCMLTTHIMASFSQKAEIDENLVDKIIERMLFFMKDISHLVRAQAVLGLQRLQDPDNQEDAVTKAYIYHMESDPAPKVRQAVITAIAKKITNIPSIIERLHDVDEKVRRHTYLQMASFSVKSYRIADRIAILSTGLNDRSEMVKKAVTNILLANWVGVYDFDYAELIRAVKLDSSEKDLVKFRELAEQTLLEVFKKRKLSDMIGYLGLSSNTQFKNCLSDKKSTLEMFLVWKAVAMCHQDYLEGRRKGGFGMKELQQDDDDDEEATHHNETISNVEVLPELSTFCDYINRFAAEYKFDDENEKLQKNYFNQCIVVLLEIVQLNDLGDELGKKRLHVLLRNLLLNYDLHEYAIKKISQIINETIPNVDGRLDFFNEIINEYVKAGVQTEFGRQSIIEDLIAKSGIDIKVKANKIKLRMMDLKEEEASLAEKRQYGECQEKKDEYSKLNSELIELLRPIAENASVESKTSLLLFETLSNTSIKKHKNSETLKFLKICYYAINSKGVKNMTREVLTIYNEFVRYHLESKEVYCRIWALKTATAYSLLYDALSNEIFNALKSQIFRNTQVFIWECSIECIIDLILRYGIEALENPENRLDGTSNSLANISQNRSRRGGGRTLYTDNDGDGEEDETEMDLIKSVDIMSMLLHVIEQNVDKRIHKVTIIGICKLILSGIHCTRDIVSKFLLMYFNPATDAEISQILGIFLENIVKLKKQEILHSALIPTIITLVEAPHDSPLREVKLETVLKYIVGATRPVFCSNGLNLHNIISMKLLEFMRENSDSKDILKIFSKELLEMEVSDDPLLRKDLTKQIEIVLKESNADTRTKKYLTDFRDILNGNYKAPLKFSSSARLTTLNAVEEDEGLENIEEENENDKSTINEQQQQAIEETNKTPPDTPVTEIDVSSNKTMTPSKKRLLDISKKPATNCSIINETATEETVIPNSPQHIDLPATQEFHIEVPATQEINLTNANECTEISVISSDDEEIIPATPVTPATVKATRQRGKVHVEEQEEYPPTPESARGRPLNAKRVLEISRSAPSTPSVASPMRKTPRIPSTPITPSSSQSKSQNLLVSSATTSTPKPRARMPPKTPQSEGRITRKQAKDEVTQNTTMTRAATKNLNAKPSSSSDSEKSSKDVPQKKNVGKPSKLPVKKTNSDPNKKTEITNTTRTMRTARGAAAATANKPGAKNNTSRPPWK